MRGQRVGDFRTRSPPRMNIRDQKYSPPRRDNQERHSRFVSGSFTAGQGERGNDLVERRDYDAHLDGDRDMQLQRLSLFNEGLSRQESPSMKFQWRQLLAETPNLNNNSNPSSKLATTDGVSRMGSEKEYQGSRLSGLGGHDTVVTKPLSLEIERANVGIAKNSGHIDGRFASPLEKLNAGFHHDEGFAIRHNLCADNILARELLKEEEKPTFYLKDASHFMMPSSHPETLDTMFSSFTKNNFPGSYDDGLYNTSDGIGKTLDVLTEPISYGGRVPTTLFESPTKPDLQAGDMIKYQQAQLSPTEAKLRDYTSGKIRRSERGDQGGTLSDEFFGKMAIVRQDYGHRDTQRASIVDPIVNRIDVIESSHGDHLRESSLLEHLRSLQEQPISNYHDVSGASYPLKQYGEVLGSRSIHLEFATEEYPDPESPHGTEAYQDHENLHFKEDYGFERDAGPWSYEEQLDKLPMSECDHHGSYRIPGSPHRRLTTEKLGLPNLSEKILKRKRCMDMNMNRHKPKINVSADWNASHKIQDPSDMSNKSGHSQYGKSERAFDEIAGHRISDSDDLVSSHNLSVSMQRRLSKPHISAGRDIRKQLRPGPQNILNPSLRNRKPGKVLKRRQNDFHGSLHASGGDPPETKVSDPPEDSEEFKQQVYSAFLKFFKQLNENPAQRRRYTEQGKADSLKCSICGSDSKEFVDPQSLAMHAFKFLKIESRATHLGFHKALCVLMGWNSAVAPNSSWVHLVLPDAEALALKEDLIVWPPVVIIHNSSIGNNYPNERMIVTIEVLETILRDMGFDMGNTKVCRGKPANQSIMVVKFKGIYSGLQEAERLHKFYAENKHGRAEFQQIRSSSVDSSRESRILVDKAEQVLYGYLGIAGDLDKLDFETKKRFVVKSKKDIQAIADAPLKTKMRENSIRSYSQIL